MEELIMASRDASEAATQMWGLVVAQGVLAVLAGIAMLFWPAATAVLLVVIFGIFVLVWGIIGLVQSLLGIGKISTWWLELAFSILAIGLGVFLLRNTEVGLALFILLIGFTFIIRGVVDLLTAFFSRDEQVREARALFVVTGILGLVAGVIVLSQPVASGLAFIWIVGLYTVLQGSMMIAIALRARSAFGK
jgi:uncharacterized membrane protein HdeD (DUF308 family)